LRGKESKKEILSKITNANTFLEINLIGCEEGKKVNFIHRGSNSNINQTGKNQSYNKELTTIDAIAKKTRFSKNRFDKIGHTRLRIESIKRSKIIFD
jgi:hypothetical protein